MELGLGPNSLEIQQIFRNLDNVKSIAIDIGGSLTKIAYFSTVSHRRTKKSPEDNFEDEVSSSARLHFIGFETKFIEKCLDFVQTHLVGNLNPQGKVIKVTGGGAYKYASLITEKLQLTVEKEDEVASLIKGANFLLKNVNDEAFTFERHKNKVNECSYKFLPIGHNFPYLLVNVGSGVSILKVVSEDSYERLGGTATGGGTFWGLGSLLTKAKSFDELLALAEEGDHRNVDLLVKDIYSGDYKFLGLPGDLIASSFGKCHSTDDIGEFKPSDLARSLLFTIANDIGQISTLYALQHNLSRIYFGGYFLRNHPLSMHAVSYAIKYWSKGKVECLFLRHEGYLGAIGAFLKGTEEDNEKYSWQENYAMSSGFQVPEHGSQNVPSYVSSNGVVEQLEIDRFEKFGLFPLLKDDTEYFPDTENLSNDLEARDYWLTCFEKRLETITAVAIESQRNSDTAPNRALRCRSKLHARFQNLKTHPSAFGTLTVRGLLDTIEQSLREFDFPDPYLEQKETENGIALSELKQRFLYLDSLDNKKRNIELIWGILSGNVFDWGAKAVTAKLEGPEYFGYLQARDCLQKRPWLRDDMDLWIERIERNEPHKAVAIFVDNSGYDFVLGIIPFARQLLMTGSKVILCANNQPSINDMTYSEMTDLVKKIDDPIIQDALRQKRLFLQSSGQSSPCLDLSRSSHELNELCVELGVSLVVIEGMGRVIHTNFNAEFKVECLKLAVIKNSWLAKRLGGSTFSVVCKYEL